VEIRFAQAISRFALKAADHSARDRRHRADRDRRPIVDWGGADVRLARIDAFDWFEAA
jgi:hypothetical protein